MRNNDHDAFKALLADAYILYRVELTAGVVDMWWNALKPHNLSDVKQALSSHMADPDLGQFPPKPADLIKRILPNKGGAEPLCDHCAKPLGTWTKFGAGRICNPCYRTYLAGEWAPERAA